MCTVEFNFVSQCSFYQVPHSTTQFNNFQERKTLAWVTRRYAPFKPKMCYGGLGSLKQYTGNELV